MLRRGIALALWAYFGWYLGSLVVAFTGLPSSVGPALAVLVAALAIVDWRRLRSTPRAAPAEDFQLSR